MRKDEKKICHIYSKKTVRRYQEKRKTAFFNKQLVNPTFRRVILEQKIANKKIIDIGCGYGADMDYLLKHGATKISGAEINPHFLEELKKNPDLANTKTYQQSIYHLDLPQKYDLALSNMVLDQVQDLRLAFSNVTGVLKNNGLFIFSVMHPLNIATKDYKANLSDYFEKKTKTVHPKSLNKDLFIYQRTMEDFSRALAQNGFVIKSIHEPQPKGKTKKETVYYKLPGVLIICAQLIK